ncbi:MAG: hypothetical protein KDE08_07535 [Rhodobacteraceae bacterium]|nr:hypothetical protein [Paracoccaceae bacterium]
MSTNGLESWAVDLAEVGAVYPFQGWEFAMTVVGVIFWLGWHRIQYVRESAHLDEAAKAVDKDKIMKSVERY